MSEGIRSAQNADVPVVADADTAPRTLSRRIGLVDARNLTVASHPMQAFVTAVAVGSVAALISRPAREIGVVMVTVLVGQAILGWHNDLVDAPTDRRHGTPGKPIAAGTLDRGTTWFAVTVGVLLLVPLSLTTGVTAGCAYLASFAIAALGNLRFLRRSIASPLPWAASFAWLPAYVSLGGWGGSAQGASPEPVMVVLFAALGVGVHFGRSLFGLVPDNEDGWRYLPLRLSLRIGATRMLALTGAYLAAVLVLMAIAGSTVGLRQ